MFLLVGVNEPQVLQDGGVSAPGPRARGMERAQDVSAQPRVLRANRQGTFPPERLRRLPEKNVPDCAGFSFVFKKR
jgi:hypothetical protein